MAAPILARQASPIDDVLAALQSPRTTVKVWALIKIAQFGAARAAQFQLDLQVVPLLDDSSMEVQEQVLRTLSFQGDRGARHCYSMAKKIRSPVKSVKLAAVRALGNLRTLASEFSSDVVACLDKQDPDLEAEACLALGKMKATSSGDKVAKKLTSTDAEVVAAACSGLAAMDREAGAVAELLAHKDGRVKAAAAEALKDMTGAEDFIPSLVKLVGDREGAVRRAAAVALRKQGKAASSRSGDLAALLKGDSGVAACAAYALAGLGTAAKAHSAALEALLASDAEDTSAAALSASGAGAEVPASLRKPAAAAAEALGAAGAVAAAPRLAERLGATDVEVRIAAAEALGQLGTTDAAPALQRGLEDSSPLVVAACACALSLTAPSPASAAAVAQLLEDPRLAVRSAAATALGQMAEAAQEFALPVSRLLDDKLLPVKVAALQALPCFGVAGQRFAAEVCRLAMRGEDKIRMTAMEALTQMGGRGAAFAEELEAILDDPIPEVRTAAHRALQSLSNAEALPSLQDLPKATESPVESPAPALPNAGPATGSKVCLLFPGQGSQYQKMLATVKDLPGVRDMLQKADKILDFDLLKLCLEGPEEQLEATKYCQPAMYVAGLAGLEQLKLENPSAATGFAAVAGLSLGEYTALTAAGTFDFETGLRLVKLRAEAMQEATQIGSAQAMASIAGLARPKLEGLCRDSIESDQDTCQVANVLFPNGFSCAGTLPAVQRLVDRATATAGCLQAKLLKTSGAFHTKLMQPAREKLLAALKAAEPSMKPPKCDLYANLTGTRIPAGTPVGEIINTLADQLTNCVLWEPAMRAALADGLDEFYELGPMKQLKAMMKRIDAKAWQNTQNVMV